MIETWLDAAEATLTSSLAVQASEEAEDTTRLPQEQHERENVLGEVLALRAYLRSYQEDGQAALPLCQQALALLSEQNFIARAQVAFTQSLAYFYSSANDAMAACRSAQEGSAQAQKTGNTSLALFYTSIAPYYLIRMGQLHEAWRVTQQGVRLGEAPGGLLLPEVGWHYAFQADILREWNELDAALELALQAVSLRKQTGSLHGASVGYAVLMHVCLSRGELDMAHSALQQFEHLGKNMDRHLSAHLRSIYTTVDQVRLWLATRELDRATRWTEELERGERQGTAFAREQEEMAHVRIFLAKAQPALALERLESLIVRATTAGRWDHVIEMRLLEALAHQMLQQEQAALSTLAEAVRLGEPEGYIRRFVDEGAPMAVLLSKLRERQRKQGPTLYLDTVLAAFTQEGKTREDHPGRMGQRTLPQPLLDPLSERELEVLHLLVRGDSNQEIAEALVVAIDMVKRHVSNIFSKLGVHTRVQAAARARALGLLSDES